MRKLTTEEIIIRFKSIHGNRYDYSLVEYVNALTKIKIICPKHGIFEQRPGNHLSNQNCPKCAINATLTTKEFIKRAKEKHKNLYDYSVVKYINSYTKIKIICSIHGVFEQTPQNHIFGQGCPRCGGTINLTTEEFVKKAIKIHVGKYNYSLVKYINTETKVKIICPKHGVFMQSPEKHIKRSQGCPNCNNSAKLTTAEFIEKAKKVHGDIYDYSKVIYKNSKTEVDIICQTHGLFKQKPDTHLRDKSGCQICRFSHGEKEVNKILKENNTEFITQKKFKNCKNKRPLPFDFYLPEQNICIEFNGIQHYKPISFFGGKKEFEKLKKRDKIKKDFCKKEKINLIIIKYNDNIEVELEDIFRKHYL